MSFQLRLRELAVEFVCLQVDVLVVYGPQGIRLKTAEALGLTTPPSLLFQADAVIQ